MITSWARSRSAELGHDPADVGLDRQPRSGRTRAASSVLDSPSRHGHDLTLTGGEVVRPRARIRARTRGAANSAISLRVTAGRQRASFGDDPDRVEQLLRGGVLEEEPARAGAQGGVHVSSRSNVVRTSTRTPASPASAPIRRVASMPSITGIRTSMSTTSGPRPWPGRRPARRPAPHPPPRGPARARPCSRKPARIISWSSAMPTRIVISHRPRGSSAWTAHGPAGVRPADSTPPAAMARSRMPRRPLPSSTSDGEQAACSGRGSRGPACRRP